MTTATLATMPGRERACEEAVASLADAVDLVLVYDNAHGYDLGDAGKFAACPSGGIHLTCDDDIVYGADYVKLMLDGLRRYPGSIVTLHGKVFPPRPLASYYRDNRRMVRYHNQRAQEKAARVDVPGTGVMAYHTETIRFSPSDFPQTHRNMADLHVGLKAMREDVPIICLAHAGDEVKLSPHVDHGKDTIWADGYYGD